jgi:hypothetical protein
VSYERTPRIPTTAVGFGGTELLAGGRRVDPFPTPDAAAAQLVLPEHRPTAAAYLRAGALPRLGRRAAVPAVIATARDHQLSRG